MAGLFTLVSVILNHKNVIRTQEYYELTFLPLRHRYVNIVTLENVQHLQCKNIKVVFLNSLNAAGFSPYGNCFNIVSVYIDASLMHLILLCNFMLHALWNRKLSTCHTNAQYVNT